MRDIFKQFLLSNIVLEKNYNFFLDNRAQTTQNTILDVVLLVYFLFRLMFILNLSFSYISCNFAQKRNAIESRKNRVQPGLSGSTFKVPG